MVHIVLAGGGTAGHTSPLIATAQALQASDPDVTVSVVGTPKGIESRVIPEAGLELDFIPPVPLPRRPGLDLVSLPPRLATAIHMSRQLLRRREAAAVVGFGGYASLPVYLAARTLRIPVIVHEQNALPGLANRVAARFATRVCVTFGNTKLPRAEYVGMPLRAEIAHLDRAAQRPEARRAFGLPETGPVLLVSGGSQGAKRLNTAVTDGLPDLLGAGINVLHVLGPKNMTPTTMARTQVETGASYQPVAFVSKMGDAYAAADLMLGRSGASTVAETAAVGLPGIFVPLPHGNGEQARNAESLVAAGGAILVPDESMSAAALTQFALPLLNDPERLHAMSRAGRDLMPTDAAQRLAGIALSEAAR